MAGNLQTAAFSQTDGVSTHSQVDPSPRLSSVCREASFASAETPDRIFRLVYAAAAVQTDFLHPQTTARFTEQLVL